MTDIEQQLHEVIINVLRRNHNHDLHYVASRSDVRDDLMATLTQTFDIKPSRNTD
jgi:hypothetical protein